LQSIFFVNFAEKTFAVGRLWAFCGFGQKPQNFLPLK